MNSSMNTNEDCSEFLSNLAVLRQTHVFSPLPMEAVKLFAYLCTRELYKQGDYLFKAGEDDGCSYYVLTGSADLILKSDGKASIVRNYPKESFLGALSMLAPMPRLFSLRAASDLTAMVMTREKLTRVIEKFPELTLQIVKAVARKIDLSEKQTIEHFQKPGGDVKDLLGSSLI